ncbi:MAG TPA: hypothetical protein VFH61_10655 [Thermoleophilia bacterium]|nr:hypothetical protein [Thermoleophilia bacterium]
MSDRNRLQTDVSRWRNRAEYAEEKIDAIRAALEDGEQMQRMAEEGDIGGGDAYIRYYIMMRFADYLLVILGGKEADE